jgi:hypothetical protein
VLNAGFKSGILCGEQVDKKREPGLLSENNETLNSQEGKGRSANVSIST